MKNEFGQFIEKKRREKEISLRGFAELIDIAPAYMSDIEKGHRPPPVHNMEILNSIAKELSLNDIEKQKMFDLATNIKDKKLVSPDIQPYIMQKDLTNVRVALRLARDTNADNDVWQEVIRILEERKNKN